MQREIFTFKFKTNIILPKSLCFVIIVPLNSEYQRFLHASGLALRSAEENFKKFSYRCSQRTYHYQELTEPVKCHPNLHFCFSIFATFFATFLAILFAGSKRGHVTERKEAKLSCYEFSFVSFFKILLVQVSILTRSSAKQLINYLIAWLSEFLLILR